MDSKLQAIIRAGGICAFLGTTSLTAFYGWYKAVSIPPADASIGDIGLLDTISNSTQEAFLETDKVDDVLEQAQVFEMSRNFAPTEVNNQPIEIRLVPTLYLDQDPADGTSNLTSKEPAEQELDEPPVEKEDPNKQSVSLSQGSNIIEMLEDAGLMNSEAWKVANAMKNDAGYSLNKIPAGKDFQLIWRERSGPGGNIEVEVAKVRFIIDAKTSIEINRQPNGDFTAERLDRPTIKQTLRGDAVIKTTLFQAGADAGIPQSTLAKLLRVFSWDIDFEREVKAGDKFSLLYKCDFDENSGERLSCNDILYAAMTIGGKKRSLYSFTHQNGQTKFYSEKGFSAQKRFMKTPVNMSRARISSKYGYRRHPTLGYSKLHAGIDFAAPTGTPIYAASDGKITVRSRRGTAGNMVEIVHGKYKTRYMHMSRFAQGQRVGGYVKQGQIIGYVGTTGRSTGPHLHYEIRLASNNNALNPLTVSPVSSGGLSSAEAKAFQNHRKELDNRFASTKSNYIPDANAIKTAIKDGAIGKETTQISGNANVQKTSTNDATAANRIPIEDIVIKARPKNLG
ncbi:MAG: peptidoglycan DD-metalloendopeptidase family protein [Alphaproteobacteria bacterium]